MDACWWCALLLVFPLPVFVLLCTRAFLTYRTRRRLRSWSVTSKRPFVVGFFHPYCNAGGGGERVLWHAVDALQKRYEFVEVLVYTGDVGASAEDILSGVEERFGIRLVSQVHFVFLRRRKWVEAHRWPRFTILGQTLGSVWLGLEALFSFVPHVYIDSMGYAFTLPLFRWLGGSRTASYVHYPIVSTDMMTAVETSLPALSSSPGVAHSKWLRRAKVLYYRLFAWAYGIAGRRNSVVMVNSSWTYGHIKKLWRPKALSIVYPPCDTKTFLGLHTTAKGRPNGEMRIVSVGQFRPEKRHEMQLRILALLKHQVLSANWKKLKLVFVGGCRHDDDRSRVQQLRQLAKQLKVSDRVEFKLNISFAELKEELAQASVGLHTMWNEHFGIAVVELMAAGAVVVADNSGGPQMDIVKEWRGHPVGFLAGTEDEYMEAILRVMGMREEERKAMAQAAKEAVHERFSVETFESSFLRATECLLTS